MPHRGEYAGLAPVALRAQLLIEDQPGGDGAFSSAGAFGFYPWITADKRYYGMLVRETLAPRAYVRSTACGALMRRAFAEGRPQHPPADTSINTEPAD